MMPGEFLPDFPAKRAHGRQNGIAGFRARMLVLSWLGVLARRDDRLRATLRNRFMTVLGFVDAVVADARDHLIDGNLVEQAWQ